MLAGVRRAQVPKPVEQMRMAAVRTPPTAGFVLDYATLVTSTNFRFAADITYFVSGSVALSATTTFEGGTVLKFSKSSSATITISGSGSKVVCESGQYRPVIFTAKDDNNLGDSVGGSGSPSGYYGATYLSIDGNSIGTNTDLSNMRFMYASNALTFYDKTNTLTHAQFLNCRTAVQPSSGEVSLRNILGNNITTMIGAATNSIVRGEHWTLHNVNNLYDTNSPATIYLTNCLLVTVTNFGTSYTGANNTNLSSDVGVFQTVALGKHYLTNNSPYRDLGTTNTSLLSDLALRTTYSPTSFVNQIISTDTVWSEFAWRDRDIPDLGYHYDPLDAFTSGTVISNATLTVTNAAVATDFSTGSWGIILKNSKFITLGSPTRLSAFVRGHMVQETGSGNPGTRAIFYDGASATSSNELRMRFALFAQLPNDGYMVYVGNKFSTIEVTHSAVYDPAFVVDMMGATAVGITNTLWERGGMNLGVGTPGSVPGTQVQMRNNLIRNSYTHFHSQSNWRVCDNLVDTSTGFYEHGVAITNLNNAYYGTTNVLTAGINTQMLASLTYVTGPLGLYYQPTNSPLINAGSTNADKVALYHFTTTTNQVKETTSTNDIGLHYVALDANGLPLDADGDGIPDYYEDTNGNGSVDSGESDWQSYDSPNGLSSANPLRVYTPIKN